MELPFDICKVQAPEVTPWALAAALATPHFMYAFIWFRPQVWYSWFGKRSVDMMATAAHVCKVLQFSAALCWLASSRPNALCLDAARIQYWQLLAAVMLAAFGQSLNAGIYKAIGKAGVYYGFKLRHSVPWHTGFPFNVVSHPQYVGSVATLWAAFILYLGQAPAGMLALTLYWTGLYVVTGLWETYC